VLGKFLCCIQSAFAIGKRRARLSARAQKYLYHLYFLLPNGGDERTNALRIALRVGSQFDDKRQHLSFFVRQRFYCFGEKCLPRLGVDGIGICALFDEAAQFGGADVYLK